MQEFACNSWFKTEFQRLLFQRLNQTELRAEAYQGLVDSIQADEDVSSVGDKIILTPSHTGSPRWYQMKFQDAMAIVRKHGKPHIFLVSSFSNSC